MFRSLSFRSAVAAVLIRLSVVVLVAWSATAQAQGVTGSAVTGTVSEEGTEMPLEGTILQLKNPSTGDTFNTVTDASGHYFFDNVPSGGPYTLSATAPRKKGAYTYRVVAVGKRTIMAGASAEFRVRVR